MYRLDQPGAAGRQVVMRFRGSDREPFEVDRVDVGTLARRRQPAVLEPAADISTIDPHGRLADPRHEGVDASSWDAYMDTTIEYYIRSFPTINYDPSIISVLDLFLTLRREKPRPLPLVLVHGDFNPANFLYEGGRVTALIDWENSRIGDPREDLGWMTTMDIPSNSNVMAHPVDEGGFLAYFNELTSFEITQDEVDYFTLFGTANIAVPVQAAIKRRIDGESVEFMHPYLAQSAGGTLPNLLRLLNYPGSHSEHVAEHRPDVGGAAQCGGRHRRFVGRDGRSDP